MRRSRISGVAAVVTLIGLAASASAGATTFAVTTQADNTTCVDGNCSLRGAVLQSNSAQGQNTITVPPGHYTLTGAANDDADASGDLDITHGAVTIVGTGGAAVTQISGGGGDRVFDVPASAISVTALTLSGLTIEAGGGVTAGAGIEDDNGTLTLTNDDIEANETAAGGDGGGVYYGPPTAGSGNAMTVTNTAFVSNIATGNTAGHADGGAIAYFPTAGASTLTVTKSSFTANTANQPNAKPGGIGGAIAMDPGVATVTISGSLFNDNSALSAGTDGNGGAIWFAPETDVGSALNITNSTIVANSATGSSSHGRGGAIFTESGAETLGLTNDTIAGNSAGAVGGGGALDNPDPTTPANTIFADNTAGGVANTCSHPVTTTIPSGFSGGFNLIADQTCGLSAFGDGAGNPALAPLADNGGPTHTSALGAGSAAIDRVPASECPATDQRGVHRPQGDACDIGAFEAIPPPVVAPIVAPGIPIFVPPVPLKPRLTVASKYVHNHDGSVTVSATVNVPGTLRVHDASTTTAKPAAKKKAKPTALLSSLSRTLTKAATVKLTIKPTAAGRSALRHKHSVPARILITFAPKGASAAGALSKAKSVTLVIVKKKSHTHH